MNFDLLRPVIFAELKVGDVLQTYTGMAPTIAYKGPDFAVLRFKDGSEGPRGIHYLKSDYKLVPLCWVENKPVYPGDGPLYYKDNPSWKHNEEGVFALSIRDDELLFHGGMAFPITDATWTKPEPKRIPSFQVEGVDVFPGDTVYYYGINKGEWGAAHTVKENGYVVWQRTGHIANVILFDGGEEAFRLKPQLVIGDRLVPVPEREAPAVGTPYFTPNVHAAQNYSEFYWYDMEYSLLWLKHGLVHLNKEAAIAHTEAFIALSKRKG